MKKFSQFRSETKTEQDDDKPIVGFAAIRNTPENDAIDASLYDDVEDVEPKTITGFAAIRNTPENHAIDAMLKDVD